MQTGRGLVAPRSLLIGVAAVVVLLVIVLVATIYLTLLNNTETEEILVESVKAELIASSVGAREIITHDMDLFESINSQEDVDANWDAWVDVVEELRLLKDELNGQYIYALKEIDGVYYFVFDTDPEVQKTRNVFVPYELSPVHQEAFEGRASAGLANVVDKWGSFNTGALPLFNEQGKQVGIVATDIPDTFIERNRSTSGFFATILIVATSAVVVMMLAILLMLIRRNAKTQKHLFRLANYDPISGLPNRYNLFSFLAFNIERLKHQEHTFAVFFIDLDNFKTVNDQAGHDTGDELLRQISSFLNSFAQESTYASINGMDALTARIGGDEFLQLVPGVSNTKEASEYAEALLKTFRQEASLRKYQENFGVGLSIGVSLFPSMQTDYDELIKYADIAMYHAKNNGKNGYCVYDFAMGDNVEGAELSVRSARGPR